MKTQSEMERKAYKAFLSRRRIFFRGRRNWLKEAKQDWGTDRELRRYWINHVQASEPRPAGLLFPSIEEES